jgi:hypothetical protein
MLGERYLTRCFLCIWMMAHAREARWVCGTVMQSCNLDHGMAVAARTALPWMIVLSTVPYAECQGNAYINVPWSHDGRLWERL